MHFPILPSGIRTRAVLWMLIGVHAVASALAQQKPPSTNPAFRSNTTLWITTTETGLEELGTELKPFVIGRNGVTFDRFMSRFRGVMNVTFCMKEGVYRTQGSWEVLPGRSRPSEWWEPGRGWRILGAGTNKTFIVLDSPSETVPTKHVVIGNPISGQTAEHVEIAHLTIDAQGELHARTRDSSFGCLYLAGSYIHIHDVECKGEFNALSPNAHNAGENRELFILGLAGRDRFPVTNNIIRHCVVVLGRQPPKAFPGVIQGLTSAIVNAANTGGLDNFDDLTHSPVIESCEVVGHDVERRVNGISIFGAKGGLAVSNVVRNVQFGFYSDDAPFTDSVWVMHNVFSNTVHGIYLNYNQTSYRWSRFAALQNTVYLNDQWALPTTRFTAGINIFGALPSQTSANMSNVVVAGNQIHSISGIGGDSPRDQGVLLTGCGNAMVLSNRVFLTQAGTSIRVLPHAQRPEFYSFCQNASADGSLILARDRSLPGCSTDSPTRPEECYYISDCPSEDSPLPPPFDFAASLPLPRPYPSAPLPGLHFAWEAEEGDLIKPAFIMSDPDAVGAKAVTSPVEEQGGVRFSFFLPLPRLFPEMVCWARIHPSSGLFSGFFDVELNGERLFSGHDNEIESQDYIHYPVTERIPVINTNRIRKFSLGPGWHTLTFWCRNPGVRLDQVFLTTSAATVFRPNGAIVQRLRADGRGGTLLANECPWSNTLQAEDAQLTAPVTVIPEALAEEGAFVRSSVADRGEAGFRIWVPRSGNYQIALRMRPASVSGRDSCALLVDGREWSVVCAPRTGWDWTSNIGMTEELARAPRLAPGIFRLAEGWHTLTWRTRHPGVDLDAIRLMAVENDLSITTN